MAKNISEERQMAYYIGGALMVIGGLLGLCSTLTRHGMNLNPIVAWPEAWSRTPWMRPRSTSAANRNQWAGRIGVLACTLAATRPPAIDTTLRCTGEDAYTPRSCKASQMRPDPS
jgi:hypothetical protein